MIEGPAGIGKTAVLAAARASAEGQGMRVLRSRGAELEREFAARKSETAASSVRRPAPPRFRGVDAAPG